MIKRAWNYFRQFRQLQRVNMALVRSSFTASTREIHPPLPETWEFCGFSQNGEDGIIDYLLSRLKQSNRFFIEIGAADGLENNTSLLAIAKKYSGLMIEADPKLCKRLDQLISSLNMGVEVVNCLVTKDNVTDIVAHMPYLNPDLFSLDIDGNDFHILSAFLEQDLRPKIIVVEYNSAFGKDLSLTIPYDDNFNYLKADSSGLYYGVGLLAWQRLLQQYGYRFVTVDSNGVNAFFIHPDYYAQTFIDSLKPIEFKENFYQLKRWKTSWRSQFEKIKHLPFEVIK